MKRVRLVSGMRPFVDGQVVHEPKHRLLTCSFARLLLFALADLLGFAHGRKVLVPHRFGGGRTFRVLVLEEAVDQVDRSIRDEVLVICASAPTLLCISIMLGERFMLKELRSSTHRT